MLFLDTKTNNKIHRHCKLIFLPTLLYSIWYVFQSGVLSELSCPVTNNAHTQGASKAAQGATIPHQTSVSACFT